jgi:hypothetical protein
VTEVPLKRLAPSAIAGLGALLVTASVAHAGAGDDARIVYATKLINSGAMDGVAIQCPPGERAIGGGSYSSTWLAASGPIGPNGQVGGDADGDVPVYWFTSAYNLTGQSREYRFHAICSASSDATVQVADVHLASPPNALNPTRGDAAVECPSGQRAIGGGVTYGVPTVPGGARIDASGPLDETGTTGTTVTGDVARYWYAEASNFDPAPGGQNYFIYAVCSPTSQATLKTIVHGTNDNIDKSVVCPAGSRATGGGAVPVLDIVTLLSDSSPADASGLPFSLFTGDVPRGWYAFADNEDITNAPISHSVVCDPPTAVTPAEPPSATPSTATGRRAAALKKCKAKRSKKARKKCRRKARKLPA